MTISSAAIIYHNGKYLLQKRDKNKNIFFPNFWGLFGGLNLRNEKPVNALRRELKEELNLKFISFNQILSLNIQSKKKLLKEQEYTLNASYQKIIKTKLCLMKVRNIIFFQ